MKIKITKPNPQKANIYFMVNKKLPVVSRNSLNTIDSQTRNKNIYNKVVLYEKIIFLLSFIHRTYLKNNALKRLGYQPKYMCLNKPDLETINHEKQDY